MIRVTGLYRWRPGATFDHAYYRTTHMAFVRERLAPLGLLRLESDRVIRVGEPRAGDVIAASQAYFRTLAEAQNAAQAAGKELLDSAAQHTNLVPELSFSEVTPQGDGSDGVDDFVEFNRTSWSRFERDVADVTAEEAAWRPLPQANTIALILRHLRIDAAWHADSIERDARARAMATGGSGSLDFRANVAELSGHASRIVDGLSRLTRTRLRERTTLAYSDSPPARARPAHFLGFHFALHLAGHGAQIRTLRNLYAKVQGRPARFFPDNDSFPTS
jgi:uncharacterized protein (TIGR02118 family)